MTIEEKINSMQGPQSYEEKLYRILLNATFFKDPFRTERLGENMAVEPQFFRYGVGYGSGVIDHNGNVIIPAKYYMVRLVNDHLFEVEVTLGGEHLLFDTNGNRVD